MKNVIKRFFVTLAVFIVLTVRTLHLQLHIVKERTLPVIIVIMLGSLLSH